VTGLVASVLLPTTDAAVAAQLLGVLAVGIALFVRTRSSDLRWFVAGVTVLAVSLMGVRALH